MLKAYKSWPANCSGPPKARPTSKKHVPTKSQHSFTPDLRRCQISSTGSPRESSASAFRPLSFATVSPKVTKVTAVECHVQIEILTGLKMEFFHRRFCDFVI